MSVNRQNPNGNSIVSSSFYSGEELQSFNRFEGCALSDTKPSGNKDPSLLLSAKCCASVLSPKFQIVDSAPSLHQYLNTSVGMDTSEAPDQGSGASLSVLKRLEDGNTPQEVRP